MKKKLKVKHRKLGRERADGQVFISVKISDIEIEERLKDKPQMGAYIHEALHTALPLSSEQEILRIEKVLCDIMWDQGYRKQPL